MEKSSDANGSNKTRTYAYTPSYNKATKASAEKRGNKSELPVRGDVYALGSLARLVKAFNARKGGGRRLVKLAHLEYRGTVGRAPGVEQVVLAGRDEPLAAGGESQR